MLLSERISDYIGRSIASGTQPEPAPDGVPRLGPGSREDRDERSYLPRLSPATWNKVAALLPVVRQFHRARVAAMLARRLSPQI